MRERIEQIIQHFKLTPARFADTIGVQRSNVSHILSGRNNPSFDFIAKILAAYPDVDAGWLITGKGSLIAESADRSEGNQPKMDEPIRTNLFDNDDKQPLVNDFSFNRPEVESIVVFYKNRTFRVYKPAVTEYPLGSE